MCLRNICIATCLALAWHHETLLIGDLRGYDRTPNNSQLNNPCYLTSALSGSYEFHA